MPIITHNEKRFCLNYMQKSNKFLQDWTFHHRVTFKRLQKGLRPFIDVGLHRKGVWLSSDDQWGACLPYFIKKINFFQK